MSAAATDDPVTLEIIAGKLIASVDEMGLVLARTAMSPVIYEVLDYACGLCDADGRLIAQSNGITLFTGTFGPQVRVIVERFAAYFKPGDVYITNDPYAGGTHTCDVTLIRPLFAGEVLIAFAVATAHWTEIGGAIAGSLPPNATEIFQEGLRMPGLRLCVNDEVDPMLLDLIRANVRLPLNCLGDLNAELAAVRIADARIAAIVMRYGLDALQVAFKHTLAHAEAQSRAAVAALPDGIYRAVDTIDGDGNSEESIPVAVVVSVVGDKMQFDFSGCARQRRAPINCTRGALFSAVKTIFKAMVAPEAVSNDGWFVPIEIVIPDGTVFSAMSPAPTGWYYEGSAQASELVWRALAPLWPDRFTAGSYMSLCATYICSDGHEDGSDVFIHIEPQHGGWGASPTRDGANGLIAVTDGDTCNYSIELLEAKLPVRLLRYALNTADGAGAGQYRGGFGLIREYEILVDGAFAYGSFGRSRERPWGAAGGGKGGRNYLELVRDGQAQRFARPARLELCKGDVLRVVTGGGGGHGDPRQRASEDVLIDFREGYITAEQALTIYGVET